MASPCRLPMTWHAQMLTALVTAVATSRRLPRAIGRKVGQHPLIPGMELLAQRRDRRVEGGPEFLARPHG